MELECTFPNLGQTPLTSDLRAKVVLRYRDLLEKLFQVPLWSTYYNDQVRLWLKAQYPQFVQTKLDLSASVVVNYLLQTYATSGKFLFQETRRDALILALKNHRPTTYLLNYIATELETLPHKEECQSRLFEEVAFLVTRCLHNPECRHIVETAIVVNCLPEKLKTQFNKQFLADLKTRYAHLDTQISNLEFNFYKNNKASASAYLNAVAPPLAFLNPNNELEGVTQVFKAKVKGGSFPIEKLFLVSLPHLWPELAINIPRLSSYALKKMHDTVCAAIQEEIQILLGQTARVRPKAVPKEKEKKEEWEKTLDMLCRTQDLKNIVLYYTGTEFVCFREDEVFKDIANHHTQKYPPDFLDKMEKRLETPLPSPVLNSPHSANIRAIISRKKGRERRERYPSWNPFARQKDSDKAEKKFS